MNFLKEAIETDPFKDSFNISGFVVLEDKKNNKILLKKHNLILKNAKKLILNKLLCKNATESYITGLTDLGIINDNSNFTADSTLRRIVFGYSESDVSYADNKSIFNNSNKIIVKKLKSENLELTTAENYNDYYVLVISADIKFSDFSGTGISENYLINTLGLVMGSKDTDGTNEFNTDDELFSRISFDPIIISQDSDLKLTYYVYF